MARSIDKNLKKLPLGAIKPDGWLLKQMGYVNELQKRLGALPGLVKNGEWESGEALPRYVRGIALLSGCLDDKSLKEKVKAFIMPILNSANEGGDFGPKDAKEQTARIEAIKTLYTYYEITKDRDILTFLRKFFKNQFNTYSLTHTWYNSRARLLEEIPAIEAVFRETDAEWLQDLALNLRTSSCDWLRIARKFPYTKPYYKYVSQSGVRRTAKIVANNTPKHRKKLTPEFIEAQWRKKSHQLAVTTDGTNIAKAVKYPATYGRFIGDDNIKQNALKMISSLEKYHGTPTGMFSCDSRIVAKSSERGVDTQATVEMIESLVEVIKETRDFHAVDLLERIVFNAISAVTFEDVSAVQNMFNVNQMNVGEYKYLPYSDRNNAFYGKKLTQGAIALLQAYPLYLQATCMTKEDELNFLSYAPCTMNVSIGGSNLTISERTSYPFRNTIVFKVEKADGEPEVKINFRVPKNTAMQLISGGQVVATSTKEISVKCVLRAGSTFMLKMSIPLTIEDNGDKTVSLYKGNVLMSLKMRQELKTSDIDVNATNVRPISKWNFTPILTRAQGGVKKLAHDEKTFIHEIGDVPLSLDEPPFELHIKSKTVANWEYDKNGVLKTPKKPIFCEEKLEKIYVPYGCTLLHIAKFPKCINK